MEWALLISSPSVPISSTLYRHFRLLACPALPSTELIKTLLNNYRVVERVHTLVKRVHTLVERSSVNIVIFVFLNTAICIFCPVAWGVSELTCASRCYGVQVKLLWLPRKSKSCLCKLYETSVYSGERAQPGGTRATRGARNQEGRAQPGGDARYPRV